jgi:hypothetical protein
VLDYVFSIVIFLLGFLFISSNKNILTNYDQLVLKKIWIYHLFFAILYYFYSQTNSADSNGYWRVAKEATENDFIYFRSSVPGTKFMYVLNYFPAKVLNLSIFTGTIFYSFLSFLGFYYFYRIIIDLVPYNSKFNKFNLFPLVLFLPNLHFWTVGTGKDTIMFFSIALFSFSLLKVNKRIHLIILSLFLMYMVRPHVFFILLFSSGFSLLLTNNISSFKKIIFSILFFTITLIMLPKVLQYVNLEESSSIDDVFNRAKNQSESLRGAAVGSSIDISSYPFPLKVFSFLFRPLFFDYNGLFSIVSSFENLLLLILTIKIFNKNIFKSIKKAPFVIKFMFYFLIFGTITFSLSLSNLGIILRMKNMFIPGFLIFILWCLSFQKKTRNNQI